MIYLDNNSTTPCAPEVVDAMLPFFAASYGNPASTHPLGRIAKAAVEKARESISVLLDCSPTEIFFTSGATESNNLVLQGITGDESRNHIVTSCIEHKSVLQPCATLEQKQFKLSYLPVDHAGQVSLEVAGAAILDTTLLVSIQAANNEVGTTQPIQRLVEIAHERGALFHCDATQTLGKIPFSLKRTGVDFASFSGHKLYGPKGIGVLFARDGVADRHLRPVSLGGNQERGLRAGTLNVPAIVGLEKAGELVMSRLESDRLELQRLHNLFEKCIHDKGIRATFNGSRNSRLPGTISLTISGVPADMLIANTPQLCISNGAACTAGAMSPSHVLLAMGRTREDAECTIRVGIGRYNSESDILAAANHLADTVIKLERELK